MHDAYLINLLIFHSNSVGSLHPSGGDRVGESSLYYQTESSDSQPSELLNFPCILVLLKFIVSFLLLQMDRWERI